MKSLFVLYYLVMIKKLNKILETTSIEDVIRKLICDADKLIIYDEMKLEKVESKIRVRLKAIESASAMYWGNAKCLQRALLQYILLRNKYGFDVDFVIGVKKFPFSSHAWVQWRQSRQIACGAKEEIVGYDIIFSSQMVEVAE